MTLAECLGRIGLRTTTLPGNKYGLAQVRESGETGGVSGAYNAPTRYGIIIRFPGYYNAYLCISYNADEVWIAADSGTGVTNDLQWHKLAFETT